MAGFTVLRNAETEEDFFEGTLTKEEFVRFVSKLATKIVTKPTEEELEEAIIDKVSEYAPSGYLGCDIKDLCNFLREADERENDTKNSISYLQDLISELQDTADKIYNELDDLEGQYR